MLKGLIFVYKYLFISYHISCRSGMCALFANNISALTMARDDSRFLYLRIQLNFEGFNQIVSRLPYVYRT